MASQGVVKKKKKSNSDEIEDLTLSNKSLITNLTMMSQLGATEPLVCISSLACSMQAVLMGLCQNSPKVKLSVPVSGLKHFLILSVVKLARS